MKARTTDSSSLTSSKKAQTDPPKAVNPTIHLHSSFTMPTYRQVRNQFITSSTMREISNLMQ
jgi:hypothetical protein